MLLLYYHIVFSRCCFCRKNRRPNRNIAPGVWSYPITLRSLVVRSTARTQKIQNSDTLSIIVFAPKQVHINDGELLNSVPCMEFRRASFPCSQKQLDFMVFGPKAPRARAHGPRPLGPMGPSIFLIFFKFCFMVWDLSRSVPMVFRSPGNPFN